MVLGFSGVGVVSAGWSLSFSIVVVQLSLRSQSDGVRRDDVQKWFEESLKKILWSLRRPPGVVEIVFKLFLNCFLAEFKNVPRGHLPAEFGKTLLDNDTSQHK